MTRQTDRNAQPIVLTIAGFDPSSGAGLTADLKVFAAHGLYGVAAATALTVQSTAGVRRVESVPHDLLSETLACLAQDLPLAGIKIGMLANEANVNTVAEFLSNRKPDTRERPFPVVLDPVLRSSSGHALLDSAGLESLRARLLPLVTCITPNVDELLLLTGNRSDGKTEQAVVEQGAIHLVRQIPKLGIVVTGGHLAMPDDLVLAPDLPPLWLRGAWVDTPATHGTGCGYSAALVCALLSGYSLIDAARAAKHYVTEALRAAIPMGEGGGSMHHLYAASPRRTLV